MYNNIKQYAVYNPEITRLTPQPIEDHYHIHVPEEDAKWYTKLCFRLGMWLVRKTGAFEQVFTEPKDGPTYTRITINFEDIELEIAKHKHMLEAIYNNELEYIIMGRDVYSELQHSRMKNLREPMCVEFPDQYHSYNPYYRNGERIRMQFAGVEVKVVPYFKGFMGIMKNRY